jgi:hypothetical protein
LSDPFAQDEFLAKFHVRTAFGSARVVLDQKLVQRLPPSADPDHDGRSQYSHQAHFLVFAKPEFSFSDFNDGIFFRAVAHLDVPADLVVDFLLIGLWRSVTRPIWS